MGHRTRLELAMLLVQQDNVIITQVYGVLHTVWKTYHFSPKSMRELMALGADPLVLSGVKGSQWLQHVSKALEIFLRGGKDDNGQFTAVYCHMDHLAQFSANADIAGRARKVMAARHKLGGRLSQLPAALRQQMRQQDKYDEMPIFTFHVGFLCQKSHASSHCHKRSLTNSLSVSSILLLHSGITTVVFTFRCKFK
ncbi:hypothetical protein PAMP_004943 [Pampus punctatissimus]